MSAPPPPPNFNPFAVPGATAPSSSADESATLRGPPPPHLPLNPGPFDDLHRKCKEISPMLFEGAKISVQKPLSNHFQVAHTLSIGAAASSYRFGATYAGFKPYGPGELFPVLLGDMDAQGNVTATALHQWGSALGGTPVYRAKAMTQIQQGQLAGAQLTLDRRSKLATYSLTGANIDVVNDAGVFVGQIMRRLTERLDLGAELIYHYGRQIPSGKATMLSYGARYTTPSWTAAASASPTALHLTYFHRQHDTLAFGVEWETSFIGKESTATLSYQAEIPEAGVKFTASADTNWTVAALMEKKLSQQLPFTLCLSGMLNHVKAKGTFGIGLMIG